jgi:hypothetical protein
VFAANIFLRQIVCTLGSEVPSISVSLDGRIALYLSIFIESTARFDQ